MKVAVLIARILLGLVFAVFGFDKLVHFIPAQMPPGDAGTLAGLMMTHKWMTFYGVIETVSGLLLLFGITLAPVGLPPGLVVGVLELFLVYAYRQHFAGIFSANAKPA